MKFDVYVQHSKEPIILEKLVPFLTVPRSDRFFIWLGKIVKSPINKTLYYMVPDWLASQVIYFSRPHHFT